MKGSCHSFSKKKSNSLYPGVEPSSIPWSTKRRRVIPTVVDMRKLPIDLLYRPILCLKDYAEHRVILHQKAGHVETGNNVHTRAVRLRLILFSKTLAQFWSKVLVDFLHSFTQINELTGAIIARHILRRIYLNNNYNYTILHRQLFLCTGQHG
jgi:hypothetical protein